MSVREKRPVIRKAGVVLEPATGMLGRTGAFEVPDPDGTIISFLKACSHHACKALEIEFAKVSD